MLYKFIVIKSSDVEKYCGDLLRKMLGNVDMKIRAGRAMDGRKTSNEYLVINRDEPYADEVIEIMKRNGHWDE
jgi:hypothetical protein